MLSSTANAGFTQSSKPGPRIVSQIVQGDASAWYEQRFILRYYRVYNLDQCEGIDPPEVEEGIGEEFNPVEKAEAVLNNLSDPPDFQYEGYQAFYAPKPDRISIPTKESFRSEAHFYATLFHELVHATGHEKRLIGKRSRRSPLCVRIYSKKN